MTATSPLLELKGIHKSYSSPVLIGVDLTVESGEVHALVGANGAGKTTLATIISGIIRPESGGMWLEGKSFAPAGKKEAELWGINLVMQELNLVSTLSVAENIFLTRLPRRLGCVSYRKLNDDARLVLETMGLDDIDPATPTSRLGIGHQQLVEIAAALSKECKLLILDEPTAALTDPQVDILFRHIRRLRARGVGFIYISHRMDEIRRIADRVTVLRDGRVVETGLAPDMTARRMVRAMIGRDVIDDIRETRKAIGPVALRVCNLHRGAEVRDVSFDVHRGEILGLSGLIGSGRTETLRAIFAADLPDGGEILVGDPLRPRRFSRPRDAVRTGIAMIPEDRKEHGLLLPLSIRANTTLARLDAVTRPGGWIDENRERETVQEYSDLVSVQRNSLEQPVVELSGGNQQKVVISRWLFRDSDVLLFDEPTRGIDVATKEAVYEHLHRLAAEGRAIVMASSDLDELMAVSDRIAVMSAGRLVETFERDDWSQDRIMAAAFSGYLEQNTDAGGAVT